MEPLFRKREVVFQMDKEAAEVTLPESPNSWPTTILQEVFKQAPYMADFTPEVNMDRVDAEQGYGLGHIVVQNKSEVQATAAPAQRDAVGVRVVRIPVIIRENKLQDLDLLLTEDSKTFPLTERRLRQAMFRPQAFDVTSKTPGDTSIVGMLYPPYRQNAGFGSGGMSVSTGMGKMGSVLGAIMSTIGANDYMDFTTRLSEPGVKQACRRNMPAMKESLSKLASFEPRDNLKVATEMMSKLKPSVVQISKEASGYVIKAANHNVWAVASRITDRGDVIRTFGQKVAEAVDESGSVTVTDTSGPPPETVVELAKPIHEFGLYKVQGVDGQHRVGFVIPNLLDIDGTELPIALFTNGTETAVQSDIAGVASGTGTNLPSAENVSGSGCFYEQTDKGICATIPFEITGPFKGQGMGEGWVAETYDGRTVQLMKQPNVIKPTTTGEEVLIPQNYKWLPLGADKSIDLVEQAEDFAKEAQVARELASVELRSSGLDSYSLRGAAIDKVASEEREFIDRDGVTFLLGGLGVTPKTAAAKMAEAHSGERPVQIRISRAIKTAEQQYESSHKTAAWVANVPNLKRNLVKEAAFVPDPTSVDAVLSLGFINPENIITFLEFLPALEAAQSHLCDLMLAARVGLREIPTAPLQKCIRTLEEVIDGLKVLAFQKN